MVIAFDEVEIYDQGMVDEFSMSIPVAGIGDVPVPIVFASPHRAFADIASVYEGISSDGDMIPLPVMAVVRTDISPDPERYIHNSKLLWKCGVVETEEVVGNGDGTSNFQFTLGNLPVPTRVRIRALMVGGLAGVDFYEVLDDGKGNLTGDIDPTGLNTVDYETGEVDLTFLTGIESGTNILTYYDYEDDSADLLMSESPNPVLITYQINLWASERKTYNQIIRQCYLRIRQRIGYITVDLLNYGKKYFSYEFEGVSDSSDLTPGEGERMLRGTISVVLKGVIFRSIESVKPIEFVDIEFYKGLDLDTAKYLESMSV